MLRKNMAVFLFSWFMLWGCSGKPPLFPVATTLNERPLAIQVDSELAAYYISDYLQDRRSKPAYDALIQSFSADSGVPGADQLRKITQATSPDFSALYLANSLLRVPRNRAVNGAFSRWYDVISSGTYEHRANPAASGKYEILFVPGWLYKSDRTTGADFSKQRTLLRAHGIPNALISTLENGTVEANAGIIAGYLRSKATSGAKIILVSASKGGPETALALHMLKGESHHVIAWINVGGILGGTLLADRAARWPWRWFVKLVILRGGSLEGIESLRTASGRRRAAEIGSLDNLIVINYVGIPMQSQVNERAKTGFALMKEQAPNDGLTFILDEIQPAARGATIVELGLDHYFAHENIDMKTLALAYTVVALAENPAD